MIGSWFALPPSVHAARRGWGWEVVTVDGGRLAAGISPTEEEAEWDCRVALFVARLEAGEEAADVALLRGPVQFGGRWAATVA